MLHVILTRKLELAELLEENIDLPSLCKGHLKLESPIYEDGSHFGNECVGT